LHLIEFTGGYRPSGLVESEDAQSTRSTRHEPPKASAVLVACGDFLPGNGRDPWNHFHPDSAGGCRACQACGNAGCCGREPDASDGRAVEPRAEEGSKVFPGRCLVVWIRIRRTQDGEWRNLQHGRDDGMSSDAAVWKRSARGEPAQQEIGGGADYGSRRAGEGAGDRLVVCRGGQAEYDEDGAGARVDRGVVAGTSRGCGLGETQGTQEMRAGRVGRPSVFMGGPFSGATSDPLAVSVRA